jgi:sulfite dehydrogenase (quinone) subunit SoeC
MHGAPSVLIFTVTAGLGQGLFVWLALAGLGLGQPAGAQPWSPWVYTAGGLTSLVLLGVGLLASFFHLGHPMRAWRAVAMWRTSWLSREVIVLPVTMAAIFMWTVAHWLGLHASTSAVATGLSVVAIALCFLLWFCTAKIYSCIKFLQEWAHWSTPLNFTLLGLASGALLMTVLLGFAGLEPMGFWAKLAIVLTAVATVCRLGSVWRNRHLHPKSSIQSAIGVKDPKVRQIAQGATGGSYNTREFFHGKSPIFVRNMRAWAVVGGAALPCLLLLLAPGLLTLAVAVVVQYTALLSERWLFFADAKHPQNLYYQTRS